MPVQRERLAALVRREPLRRVLEALDRDGEEARIVGGAVRNALMGLPDADVDIATTALPEEIMRRAAAAGFRPVPTGFEHGTVTIVADGQPFETTTLREDIETDGRRAVVRFGRDFAHDAMRRDFTMNALSLTRDGRLVDPVGGLADVAARRVRFIGDPAQRIREDYLRILRFFRFHAAYGHGAPDAAGLAACIAGRAGLDGLSRERIHIEMTKLIAAPGAVATLALMSETGLWQRISGGVVWPERLAALTKRFPDATTGERLAAAAAATRADAPRLRAAFKLSNAERDGLEATALAFEALHGQGAPSPGAARRLAHRIGHRAFSVALACEMPGLAPEAFETCVTAARAPAFPLAGRDMIAQGVPAGRLVGEALARAEALWIAADFPVDAESLGRIARQAARGA